MHEKFVDEIEFVDNRYEVKLPFKDGHPILPDNFPLQREGCFHSYTDCSKTKKLLSNMIR